jgi:hypothetical protein
LGLTSRFYLICIKVLRLLELSFYRFFHLFVAKFGGFKFLQTAIVSHEQEKNRDTTQVYSEEDDLDQCLYYLQKLSSVLRWLPDNTWAALASISISTDQSHKSLYHISMCSVTLMLS